MPGDRADEDHPPEPILLHTARCALRHPERAGEVRVDDLLEALLGHPDHEGVRRDPGIGDQHLHRSLVLLDLGEGPVDAALSVMSHSTPNNPQARRSRGG